MNELESCPFCGGEIEIDDSEMFTCLDCGLIARFPKSPKQAKNAEHGLLINNYDIAWHIGHWNTRAKKTCEGHRCEETGEWVCHKCGGSLAGCMFDPVRDGFVDVPNFCPNCGAKVAGVKVVSE